MSVYLLCEADGSPVHCGILVVLNIGSILDYNQSSKISELQLFTISHTHSLAVIHPESNVHPP